MTQKQVFDQRIKRLLDQHLKKLHKRVKKAQAQLDDATRHLEEHRRERSSGESILEL